MLKNKKNIILLGYMGSGKTSVGKALAKQLDRQFIDLDDYISKKEGLSISEIFNSKGEKHFRTLEKEYLKDILSNREYYVLALGGGTPTIQGVMKIINKHGLSIYLQHDVEGLYQNLKPKAVERPLLNDLSQDLLKHYISEHLMLREPEYLKADLTILTHGKSIQLIVNKILELLN